MHAECGTGRTEKYPDGQKRMHIPKRCAVQELGLQAGSMAVLVGDEDDPRQWFLCIVDDEGGFPVRLKKRKRYNSKGMPEEYCYGAVFNCSYLCHKILDNVGADKSATFMLATTPVEMDGLKLYKILTSNPITSPKKIK